MSKQKFVIYKRLSKENKGKSQHGFESQALDIQYYLEDIPNHEIVGEFQEFVSGGADVKPQLEEAMKLCEESGATLLVAKLDRLSRRVVQIATYMESSVNFKVATMPSANNMTLHIFGALAEEERNAIRKRVKRGLEAAKAKGIKLGAASPQHKITYQKNKAAGLHKRSKEYTSAKNGRIEIIKKMSDIVKVNQNMLTFQQLADNLNTLGITTPKGKTFSKGTVSRIADEFKLNRSNGEYTI